VQQTQLAQPCYQLRQRQLLRAAAVEQTTCLSAAGQCDVLRTAKGLLAGSAPSHPAPSARHTA